MLLKSILIENLISDLLIFLDRHWKRGSGPILFYTGNEGDIVGFWENTGFLFELAEKLHGLVIFAEHVSFENLLPFSIGQLIK